uniref:RWD domain-containing protein n=1 Tax=Trichuris muris TaxID=70415 RepID=A0A5S6QMP3_TRIMR
MEENNAQLQQEELEALTAIFGDQWQFHSEKVTLPKDYPSLAPPIYLLSSPYLDSREKEILSGKLEEAYLNCAGQPVLFQWSEIIKDAFLEKFESYPVNDAEIQEMTSNTQQVQASSEATRQGCTPAVSSGEPFTDRKSTFQAHVAEVKSKDDVVAVIQLLLANPKIARATHNMYAYRIQGSGGVWIQDCEDDGETQAGSRLLHLLQLADVRDAIVIVSRWYGGIQLGADRFKHINNVARLQLEAEGFIKHKEAKKSNKRR